jgi:Na+/melibiose symporter-like transporter
MQEKRPEPALKAGAVTGLIVAAVGSVITAMVALGVISWTPQQQQAFVAAMLAVGTAIGAVAPYVSAWWIRSRVTPVDDPKDDLGRPLRPVVAPERSAP